MNIVFLHSKSLSHSAANWILKVSIDCFTSLSHSVTILSPTDLVVSTLPIDLLILDIALVPLEDNLLFNKIVSLARIGAKVISNFYFPHPDLPSLRIQRLLQLSDDSHLHAVYGEQHGDSAHAISSLFFPSYFTLPNCVSSPGC